MATTASEKKRMKHLAGDPKFRKVMGEYGKGELHSGSKHGPEVTDPKQAAAIAYSESRKAKKK